MISVRKADDLDEREDVQEDFPAENMNCKSLFAIGITLLGLGMLVWLSLHSPGMPVQDEIAHFNISRQAWKDPRLMLDTWGRALNTIVYLLPARLSWQAARFFSIFLSLLSLLLTFLAARRMGVKESLFLIPVLLLFQPWFLQLGFTVLTEVPFCLALIAGAYFWLSERDGLASLCLGSLVLIRHEGVVFLGAWLLWMALKRKWLPLGLTITPYLLYNLVYLAVFGKPGYWIFLLTKPTDLYGSGSWFHFVKPTLRATGYLPVFLSLLAIPAALRRREKSLVFLLYILYFLTHTVIYRFGLFASGGYYLFLMPLSAGFALAAALGMEQAFAWFKGLREKTGLSWAAFAGQILLVGIVSLGMGFAARTVKPYLLVTEEIPLASAAEYLRSAGISADRIYATHPYFNYLYDLPNANWLYEPDLVGFADGSIIVWDNHYSNRWGVRDDWLSAPASPYRLVAAFGDGQVKIFARQAPP